MYLYYFYDKYLQSFSAHVSYSYISAYILPTAAFILPSPGWYVTPLPICCSAALCDDATVLHFLSQEGQSSRELYQFASHFSTVRAQ